MMKIKYLNKKINSDYRQKGNGIGLRPAPERTANGIGLRPAPERTANGIGLRPAPERTANGTGYILLDALIGVGLLGLVMASCLYLFSESINRMEDIKMKTKAAFLSQSKIEELTAAVSLDEMMNGDFGESYPGFTWTAESKNLDMSGMYNLIQLKVVVNWQVRGNPGEFSLETKFLQKK